MKRKHKRMIQECLDNFDFETVLEVMQFMQWTWAVKNKNRVPTVEELRAEAKHLLKQAIKEDLIFIGSGGLWVSRACGNLRLSFEIENWEAEK